MKNVIHSLAWAPFALAFAIVPALGGCDDLPDVPDLCCKQFQVGADLSGVDFGADANFNALIQAAADFAAVGTAVVSEVATACQLLAVDLGEPETSVVETDPAKRVEAWCALAKARIESQILAKGQVKLNVQPVRCTFSASAQASCEGKCDIAADCQAELADVEARCEPGQLAVSCEGTCKGSCEGSANLAVSCTGTCEGTCEGTCDGMAMPGGGSGSCAGACEGKCRGTCTASATADVSCEGQCSGECTGTATAPKCKAELKDPPRAECQAKGDCAASCDASASAKAECSPPAVEIEATGDIDAKAIAALKLRLPTLFAAVGARAQLLGGQAANIGGLFTSLDVGSLSAEAAVCAVPAGEAVVTAAANLTATASAGGSILVLFGE